MVPTASRDRKQEDRCRRPVRLAGERGAPPFGLHGVGAVRHDTRYFDPSKQPFMINYRVDDLDALVAGLKAAGIAVHDDAEPDAYGRFAWLMDPEGNRIELWAPARTRRRRQSEGNIRYPLEGGCLCGAVRFRIAAPPTRSGYCHCRFCQLNSGAPVVAWAEVTIEAFSYAGASPGVFRSSSWGQREFCPACGSYLVYREQQSPTTVSINRASLGTPVVSADPSHLCVAPHPLVRDR